MTRIDKALAIAIALFLALAASQSVDALTISAFLGRLREGAVHANPVPESSAALVFGLGLLAAMAFTDRES